MDRHELTLPAGDVPDAQPGASLSVFGYPATIVTVDAHPTDEGWLSLAVDVDRPDDHPSPLFDPATAPYVEDTPATDLPPSIPSTP